MNISILMIAAVLCSGDEVDPGSTWDVNHPPGPSNIVSIDVQEGTWMSVDVHPNGQELVFDLLGDLYRLPIQGGDAIALTEGMAWDMQPRYSPDGQSIAFTSDRGGGDNIWVMNSDGSSPRAATTESFRLFNSPAWSPDGRFLVGRKHYTGRRSLGAGEVWMVHQSGGAGVRLVGRANAQKDLGEPAFSPDGRYLYFSQDVTPGDRFEYNKDPNSEIYVIQRRDQQDGRVERFVTGPGGAIRPTPSPDGRSLAFIRRVRLKTVLYVRDLQSGIERPLYDALDRDNQEIWAIHGVYPGMDWTPDSQSIVFWAGGHIRRVDVATRDVTTIPFRVRSERRVLSALRYPVEVAPARFPVRALRGVRVSPSGDEVVYEALGKLYRRTLPDGEPQRLTREEHAIELDPAWSRDGRHIVYATWTDRGLGALRVHTLRNGRTRTLTREPGHYVNPEFSPDGRDVVYEKVVGGGVLNRNWSEALGIYRVSTDGQTPPVRVTRQGKRPHFGARGDRIFLERGGPNHYRHLESVDREGQRAVVHVRSKAAVQFRVSPDGEWVAFGERYQGYVLPWTATGSSIEVGPGAKGLPVTQVSRDTHQSMHFSGDSRRVYWVRGPELMHRDLSDAYSFVEGGASETPPLPENGRMIAFEANSDVPSGSVAIVGARIITMRGDEVLENGTVLVSGNRIQAVGPVGQVELPADVHRMDGEGLTVLPGFIDVHWHGAMARHGITPQQNWRHDASLAFGVTTLHDPSNDTESVFAAAELQRAGATVAPRIYSTGTILYGADASIRAHIDSVEDAAAHLRRLQAMGAITAKSYNQPRRDQRQQVVTAARDLRMMIVPEGGALFHHNMTQIVDGHTGIEHAIPVATGYEDVLQLWAGTQVGYTPTLTVAYGGLFGEKFWYQESDVWAHERLQYFVPRREIDAAARRVIKVPEGDWNHIRVAEFCKRLLDRGVHLQVGGHGQREGLGTHWEIWSMAQGGVTPHEALRAATLHGAAYLGLDTDLGSIEVGKLADLAILDANPLEQIRHSESVRFVMLGGRIYNAATMDEVGNHPQERPRAFWKDETLSP